MNTLKVPTVLQLLADRATAEPEADADRVAAAARVELATLTEPVALAPALARVANATARAEKAAAAVAAADDDLRAARLAWDTISTQYTDRRRTLMRQAHPPHRVCRALDRLERAITAERDVPIAAPDDCVVNTAALRILLAARQHIHNITQGLIGVPVADLSAFVATAITDARTAADRARAATITARDTAIRTKKARRLCG